MLTTPGLVPYVKTRLLTTLAIKISQRTIQTKCRKMYVSPNSVRIKISQRMIQTKCRKM